MYGLVKFVIWVSIRIEARGLCGPVSTDEAQQAWQSVSIRIEARGLCGRWIQRAGHGQKVGFLFALRREVSADGRRHFRGPGRGLDLHVSIRIEARGLCGRIITGGKNGGAIRFLFALRREVSADRPRLLTFARFAAVFLFALRREVSADSVSDLLMPGELATKDVSIRIEARGLCGPGALPGHPARRD